MAKSGKSSKGSRGSTPMTPRAASRIQSAGDQRPASSRTGQTRFGSRAQSSAARNTTGDRGRS
ncbi:hypothetical protein [Parafrankia sp. CH37]|uniref:hypothetical protein n=1 Tax=Parafrankia sp. CH37 TaxID=683308 RepID=UPI000DF26307|nr:hypothetical protein [Parafrankia sp. CH37]